MNKCFKVIKDYTESNTNPVKLIAGDSVRCIEESDPAGDWPNWILCSSKKGEGWVPSQIIKREKDLGTILEDYDASEFTLSKGEIVIMEKELNGWIWGYKSGSPAIRAWAPMNCLKQYPLIEYREMVHGEAKETMKVARKAFPLMYRLFIWNFKKAVVAVEDGKITGGAARHEIKTRKGLFGYLDFGFTAKESRGRGIGRETYSRTLKSLGEDGCKISGALVLCDNTASWGLLADNGCTRASALALIRKYGLFGALKIWFETAFLFSPGTDLWITGKDRKGPKTQAADIAAFLLINPALALVRDTLFNGGPNLYTAGFVFCLMLLTLLFSWIPLKSSELPVKFKFWKSGFLIPILVLLSGGIFPFGGSFYPTAEKWYYNRLRKQLGLSGLGGWIAAIIGGVFLLCLKYFAPNFHSVFGGSELWIFMILIYNSVPIVLEALPGNRVLKWNKAVFFSMLGISALWVFLIF